MKKSELVEKWWFRLIKVIFILAIIGIYLLSILIFYSDWPRKEVVSSESYFKCFVQLSSSVGDNLVYPFDKNGIYSFEVNDDDTLNSYDRDNAIKICRNVEQQKLIEATSTYNTLDALFGADANRSYDYINNQNDINYELHVTRQYNASRIVYTLWFVGWTILFAILTRVLVFIFYYIVCGKKRFE